MKAVYDDRQTELDGIIRQAKAQGRKIAYIEANPQEFNELADKSVAPEIAKANGEFTNHQGVLIKRVP